MDYSPSGSSVQEIFQARILEWVTIPTPGDFPDPEMEPASPTLAHRFFTTWEAQNGLLPSHKSEQNSAVCRDMDRPGACCIKSEREKNKHCIIQFICGI